MEIVFWICIVPILLAFLVVPILNHIPYEKLAKFKNNVKEFFNFKKNWFQLLFSIAFAILGFIIMNDKIGGKIMGAILFFAIGAGISILLNKLLNQIPKPIIANVLKIALCILIVIFAFTREYGIYREPVKNEAKVKCSMCGRRVSKNDIIGSMCRDCNDDAFGKDGWYYDIKD